MHKIEYRNNLNSLIKKVEIITDDNQRILLDLLEDTWSTSHTEGINKYYFTVNDRFALPSLINKFEIDKNSIYSLTDTTLDQSQVKIESITTSKEVISDLATGEIITKKQEAFSSLDENINVICNFSNVKPL